MLWSIDTCQNRVSADQYYLTIPRDQVSTNRGRVFFEVIRWQITSFKWSQAQVYFFQMIHMKYVVFMSPWPRTVKILISNWPRTRIFSQVFKNTGAENLFLPWSRVGDALRPIFILWLVKNWQVSSWGKFMQHLETCLLWQLKLTVLCQLVMYLTVFFHWMYKMKYSCYQESSVIHGLFVYWVLVEKCVACQNSVIRFRMASFSFFTLLNA